MLSDEAPKGRVAVVGQAEMITPFRAAGLATVVLEPGPDAASRVQALIAEGYQVIFFTEELFPYLSGLCDRYSGAPVPSLVPLPFGTGQPGIARLRAVVRRALGADLLAQGMK
ncbi:MAG: V-type ATP synthase subunit F [candidate division WOR-3 bacterium]